MSGSKKYWNLIHHNRRKNEQKALRGLLGKQMLLEREEGEREEEFVLTTEFPASWIGSNRHFIRKKKGTVTTDIKFAAGRDTSLMYMCGCLLSDVSRKFFEKKPATFLVHRKKPFYGLYKLNRLCNYYPSKHTFSIILRYANEKESNNLWWAERVEAELWGNSFITICQRYNDLWLCENEHEDIAHFIETHPLFIKIKQELD